MSCETADRGTICLRTRQVPLLWPKRQSHSPRVPHRMGLDRRAFQDNLDLPHRTIAGFTPLPFGRESFAVTCPLALVHGASYPVSVRRLADSLPASFGAGLTARDTPALRFAWGRCDRLPQRTFTSELWVMLGTQEKGRSDAERPF